MHRHWTICPISQMLDSQDFLSALISPISVWISRKINPVISHCEVQNKVYTLSNTLMIMATIGDCLIEVNQL